MRQISRGAANCFLAGIPFTRGNTAVIVHDDIAIMALHGNIIARHNLRTDRIEVSCAGWYTRTTKDRLNAIILSFLGKGHEIYQRNYRWYWKSGQTFNSGFQKL